MKYSDTAKRNVKHQCLTVWLPVIMIMYMLLMLSSCSFAKTTEPAPTKAPETEASAEDNTTEEAQQDPEALETPAKTENTSANAAPTEEEPPNVPPTPMLTGEKLPDMSPIPTPGPMFDIIDGQTIMISITEEEFIEYADFLRDALNLNDAAIAGVLANIQGESGFNPNKVGDSGSAYGICQWHGPRLDQMVKYCEDNDLNPITKEGQLEFLVHDLKDNYIYAYDLIRLCDDTEQGALQATYYFCAYYEVPSDPEEESADREELTKLLLYPRLNELSEEA